jgi:4-hydroxy-tetrahydrodipicolinate reductase
MSLRITLAGATGWVGKALVAAIAASDDLVLAGAVSRSAAGRDAGEAAGLPRLGVAISASLEEALRQPSDVVIDYTKPDAVKAHALLALAQGRHCDRGHLGPRRRGLRRDRPGCAGGGLGVLAAGNFSVTATLLRRFALEAARYVADVEIIDYASAKKPDTPSGTARELAELLSEARQAATSRPVGELAGVRETRGGALGAGQPVQVHSLRMPSFVLSCEAVFGADNERLVIRHDAGSSAAPTWRARCSRRAASARSPG